MAVMSSELDAMYSALLTNRVPGLWERVSFASLKSLASWAADFVNRVAFMRSWLRQGQPAAFALPVFFFPQVRYPYPPNFISILTCLCPVGIHDGVVADLCAKTPRGKIANRSILHMQHKYNGLLHPCHMPRLLMDFRLSSRF